MYMSKNLDYVAKRIYSNLEIENIDQWDRYAEKTAPKDYIPLSAMRIKYPEIEEKEFKKRMKIIVDMMDDRDYKFLGYNPEPKQHAPYGCLEFSCRKKITGKNISYWTVSVFAFMRYDDEYFRNNLLTALFED